MLRKKNDDMFKLAKSICCLTEAVNALSKQLNIESDCRGSAAGLATKQDLKEMENRIMSAISNFATAQTAFNDRLDAAVTDLEGDVKNLSDQIAALQSTAGQITPEDQALLDGIQARAEAISAKVEALAAVTPPVVPPVTP